MNNVVQPNSKLFTVVDQFQVDKGEKAVYYIKLANGKWFGRNPIGGLWFESFVDSRDYIENMQELPIKKISENVFDKVCQSFKLFGTLYTEGWFEGALQKRSKLISMPSDKKDVKNFLFMI